MSKHQFAACAAFALLAAASVTASADDHPYTQGAVVNVARIRTVDGKFDDYMKWVSTTWKQEEEAAKKAGYVLSYEVIQAEPSGPDDADVLLVIRYKNWGGARRCHRQGGCDRQADRGLRWQPPTRRSPIGPRFDVLLGSSTMQVLDLK